MDQSRLHGHTFTPSTRVAMDGRWKDLMVGGRRRSARRPRALRSAPGPCIPMAESAEQPPEAGCLSAPTAESTAHRRRSSAAPVPAAENVVIAEPVEGVKEAVAKNNSAAVATHGDGSQPAEDSLYIYHQVGIQDTVQSLQLRYGVDLVALKRHNEFPGESIYLLPTVRIPKLACAERRPLQATGKCDADGAPLDPKERTALVLDVRDRTGLSRPEAEAYLALTDWDAAAAVRDAKEDAEWERGQTRRRG